MLEVEHLMGEEVDEYRNRGYWRKRRSRGSCGKLWVVRWRISGEKLDVGVLEVN